MKSLEELTQVSNIYDLLPKVILEEVEEAARARRFGRSLVQINEDLVRTKGRTIVIGRRATLTASSVNEGATPSESSLSYSINTITPSKIGVCVKITQEAIDGANLDMIRDHITEAGIALADKEDLDIVYTLLGASSISITAGGTVVAGAVGGTFWASDSPGLSLDANSINFNGTLYAITARDYYDAKVTASVSGGAATVVGGTLTMDYDKKALPVGYSSTFASPVVRSGSFAVLTYEDIIAGLGVIRANKWTPDFILIHPNQVNDLLKSSAFRDASQYGSPDVLLRGEIGMISGVKILVTTNIFDGTALFIASKRAAWLALKRHVDLKRWDNPQSDSVELYFYMEYKAAVTDSTALCISVNHKSDASNIA